MQLVLNCVEAVDVNVCSVFTVESSVDWMRKYSVNTLERLLTVHSHGHAICAVFLCVAL